ncbi:hypothetical protein AHAS_Ahas01G0127600 [Arachis hypogaea]
MACDWCLSGVPRLASKFGLACHAHLFKWHAPCVGIPSVPHLRAQVACPGSSLMLASLACYAFEPKWHDQGLLGTLVSLACHVFDLKWHAQALLKALVSLACHALGLKLHAQALPWSFELAWHGQGLAWHAHCGCCIFFSGKHN